MLVAAACGAESLKAPRPAEQPEQCKRFEELMPRFYRAVSGGHTEGLRTVVQQHLLVGEREGEAPPINDVMRAVFGTMASFARLPPERGAPAGQTCAVVAPPLEQSHPLCEMRRAMDVLVHQGKGIEALALIDPMLNGAMSYIIGKQPVSSASHFEVAQVISDMCAQNAVCQLNDGLDLVIALTTYLQTPEGRASLDRLDAMVKNPALQPFLKGDGSQYGGENGIVALARIVIQTVLGMTDPAELDKLPIDRLPAELQPDVKALLADTKKVLDPKREPNVLRPLKKGLNCYSVQDRDLHLIRMLYRLGLEAKLPEFGLTNMMRVMKGLAETDQRGTLLHLTRIIAVAVRADETAVDSAAKLCRTLFSTDGNAQKALPVIADLAAQGVASEALCAADTLVFGCTGGFQPACAR